MNTTHVIAVTLESSKDFNKATNSKFKFKRGDVVVVCDKKGNNIFDDSEYAWIYIMGFNKKDEFEYYDFEENSINVYLIESFANDWPNSFKSIKNYAGINNAIFDKQLRALLKQG